MNEERTESGSSRGRRRAPFAVIAVVLLAVAVMAVGGRTADAQQQPAPPPPVVLDEPAHGAAAVTALDGDLAAVAARNDMTASELSTLLKTDHTAWVDRYGSLYYIDDLLPEKGAAQVPSEQGPFPYSQTFLLHSKPGSNRVIYLDFDGGVVSGTRWNSEDGVSTAPQPPFNLDNDASTFSNAEQDLIQGVWQRVSEDYAPFDVDVTTQDPGDAAIDRSNEADTNFGTRAMITPSTQAQGAICPGGCGGIAFVGVFDDFANHASTQPAFIFPHQLGDAEKTIAEATSHEVGHNLGLQHDGVINGAGYYAGQGSWAPIMGNSYSRPISHWSKGEYANANNTQDDLVVMQSNGISLKADDHGDDLNHTTSLGTIGAGQQLTSSGLISTPEDLDEFTYTQTCTGNAMLEALNAPTSPDLDIRMWIWDSSNAVLGAFDPASGTVDEDVASGMDATTLFGPLAAGTYRIAIGGFGNGDPATTGYSDYGSLGAYSLKVTACTDATATSISGTVRDGSGNPLKGARVTTTPSAGTLVTGADGRYSFPDVDAGTYSLKVEHLCASAKTQSVTVDGPETADVDLSMSKCTISTQTWVDGTSTLALTGDDAAATVNLPFTYRHMGLDSTKAYVSTNGHVNFKAQSTAYANTAIPGTAAPNAAIYAFWDDLEDDASSSIRTRTLGSSPNRRFVIEWNNVKIHGTTNRLSVEVILPENQNQKMVMLYKGIAAGTPETGTSATLGIENADGTKGTQLNFNQGLVYDGAAVSPVAPK